MTFLLFTNFFPFFFFFLLFVLCPGFFLSPTDAFKPPQRSIDKPFRLCVSDVFKGRSRWRPLSERTGVLFTSLFISPHTETKENCWCCIFSPQTRVQASVLRERLRLVIFRLETGYWPCLPMKPALSKVYTGVSDGALIWMSDDKHCHPVAAVQLTLSLLLPQGLHYMMSRWTGLQQETMSAWQSLAWTSSRSSKQTFGTRLFQSWRADLLATSLDSAFSDDFTVNCISFQYGLCVLWSQGPNSGLFSIQGPDPSLQYWGPHHTRLPGKQEHEILTDFFQLWHKAVWWFVLVCWK